MSLRKKKNSRHLIVANKLSDVLLEELKIEDLQIEDSLLEAQTMTHSKMRRYFKKVIRRIMVIRQCSRHFKIPINRREIDLG
jgi:hypothetical protein